MKIGNLLIGIAFLFILSACARDGRVELGRLASSFDSSYDQSGDYIHEAKRLDNKTVELIVVGTESLYRSNLDVLEAEFFRFARAYAIAYNCQSDRPFEVSTSIGKRKYSGIERVYRGKVPCLVN